MWISKLCCGRFSIIVFSLSAISPLMFFSIGRSFPRDSLKEYIGQYYIILLKVTSHLLDIEFLNSD